VDTEFTSLKKPQLISIAMICGEHEFYRELSDFDAARCSPFVLKDVLPHLGAPAQRKSKKDVAKDLGQWIDELELDCFLVSDALDWDMPLVSRLIEGWPARLSKTAVWFPLHGKRTEWSEDRHQHRVIARMVEVTYQTTLKHGQAHHALNDTRALAAAWKTALAWGWEGPTIEGKG
jgi:hypothetical protein